MEKVSFNVCIFLYKNVFRARRTLEEVKKFTSEKDIIIYVYIDHFNDSIDSEILELVGKYIRPKKITIRSKNYGLKRQVLSAMYDMIDSNEEYTLFIEDDLSLNPGAYHWLTHMIDNTNGEVICLYSEFESTTSKMLQRFSSWGYCLNKDLTKRFLAFYRKSHEGFKEWVILFGGIDLWFMLRSAKRGNIDSWAVLFILFQIRERIKSIHPASSYVRYHGIDSTGTHTNGDYDWTARNFSTNIRANDLVIRHSIWLEFRLFLTMTLNTVKRKINKYLTSN